MSSRKRFRHCLVQSLLVIVMAFGACPIMAATNVKLSGFMPPFGDVSYDFKISPDGRYIVYRADKETDGVRELYSISVEGRDPVRLNPLLPAGREVNSFLISPDGKRVVYRANQDNENAYELYSVPINGPVEAGKKLNDTLVEGGEVRSFKISPDGSQVVYSAEKHTENIVELFSVPIEGPAYTGIQLSGSMIALPGVSHFEISPDCTRVVYRSNQDAAEIYELYSVPINGPAEAGVKLNGAVDAGQDVYTSFPISPDSNRVVYGVGVDLGHFGDFLIQGLYSVPINGPAQSGVQLKGGVEIVTPTISPDGKRVVYLAYTPIHFTGILELYSIPIEGPSSDEIKLNGILVTGGNVGPYWINSGSTRVVYRADQLLDNVHELFSVPIGGPSVAGVKLSGPLAAGGSVELNFQISPDGNQVVYLADRDTYGTKELYVVPINGPAEAGIKLNNALVDGGDVKDFKISPNSNWVVYRADQDIVGVDELFVVPIGGPKDAGVKINKTPVPNGDVIGYQISPNSGRVIYWADQDIDEVYELYMTSFDETPDPFNFTDLTGVPLNTLIISNMITVAGITTETPISITGGEYSLNGGGYTSVAGVVNKGDTVSVRLTSSSSFSTTTEATLNIGGISDTFSVTTIGLNLLYLPLIYR